ncbi:MAG: hypothetical protein WA082_04610 [Candidatus Moraniibacteriota bacterium]
MRSQFVKHKSVSFLMKNIFFLFLVVNLSFAAPAKADIWGAALAATLFDQVLSTIKRQIEGAILGTLKVAAVSMLNSQVGQLIGGTSAGDALFITDWNDFLYQKPAEQVQVYMNDFFTMTTRGKYASANYAGVGDIPGKVAGNYAAYLVAGARQLTAAQTGGSGSSLPQFNLDSYTKNPETLFREGDFRGLNAFFSNPMNNPFGYTLTASTYYASKMTQEMELAKTEAQSSGVIGKKDGGRTIAPAAAIESMMSGVQNIGNDMIAAASNPGEFLSGVVGAVVNKAVTGIIQKGIGKVQANIQREVRSVDNQIMGAINQVDRELGPAARFTRDVTQKTSTSVKSYTSPPPSVRAKCGDRPC